MDDFGQAVLLVEFAPFLLLIALPTLGRAVSDAEIATKQRRVGKPEDLAKAAVATNDGYGRQFAEDGKLGLDCA
jgi:hypothetical protein